MAAVVAVAAEGQEGAAGLEFVGIGGRLAFFILDPAEGRLFIFALKDLQFAVGGGGGGEIGYEGRFLAGGDGDADGVGAEEPFDGEGWRDECAGVGHGDADHILFDGLQGMIPGDTKMIGVLNADPTGADRRLLFL
jgi:hypothetical protein